MRRRKFEILCDVGIGFHAREPSVSYRVIDKRDWFDRLFAQRRPALFIGDSPVACHQWIERYRQAEKTAADFRG